MKQCAYMAWAKSHAPARYNLANSGLLGCTFEDLPVDWQSIPLNAPHPDGWPPLKMAIASKYGVEVEQVVLAPGASGANFLACAAVLEHGDEALVERPVYEPLLSAVQFLGARVVRFERTFDTGYRIDSESIRRLVTNRTKLIVLTSPHNPSGVVAEPEELRRLGDLAREAGARILLDEVYRDSLFEEAPPTAALLGPAFVATSSLTKAYGLSGLRCGWILCEASLAERMRRLNDLMAATGVLPAEAISVMAFQHLDALSARSRALLDPNRERVHAFLRDHEGRLECVVPPRSMTVFPRLRGGESADLLHERLRARETSVVPGRFFESPRHFRLGFGGRTEDVVEGLLRLSKTLRELS